nr:hypothetical protein CFP56_41358 [Quercus suber]
MRTPTIVGLGLRCARIRASVCRYDFSVKFHVNRRLLGPVVEVIIGDLYFLMSHFLCLQKIVRQISRTDTAPMYIISSKVRPTLPEFDWDMGVASRVTTGI